MTTNTYALIHPVEISIPLPPVDGEPQPPRKRTLREIPLQPISGRMYLEFGDVSILASTPEGGSFEVDLGDKIQGYLSRRIVNSDDAKDPAPALARKALKLADAMALRADTIESLTFASNRAWQQRQGAPADTVTLLDPVEVFGQMVSTLTLSEPTGADFDRFGQIYLKSVLADGSTQFVERTEVLAKYINRCVDPEKNEISVRQLKLADVIQVKMAVNDFFTAGVEEVNGARRRMRSSSTESSPASATSAD